LREERGLPLTVSLRLAEGDVRAAEQALTAADACGAVAVERTAEGLRVRCPHSTKVAVLQALAPLGSRLLDVQIAEPSLEDLFFGSPERWTR